MATSKAKSKPRRRRRSSGMGGGFMKNIRPKWVAVGAAVEQLGSTISKFFPADATGLLAKLKRSPTGLGLAAAGYFLKSPDVFSTGLGMVGSSMTAQSAS